MLGPVKPWVASASKDIGEKYKVSTIYGVALRPGGGDHPLGLALDFMVYGDRAKGQAVADYAKTNAVQLNITYIIWYQQIWNTSRAGEGWRAMEDRGSTTQNHKDHVHVSFRAVNGGGGPTVDNVGLPNPLEGIAGVRRAIETLQGQIAAMVDLFTQMGKVAGYLADPANWLRVAMAFAGVIALLVAILSWDKVKQGATTATKTVTATGKTVTA